MSCGVQFARILLIIFNFIFWLSGAALLAVGIWMLVDPDILEHLEVLKALQDQGAILKYAAYVLIAVGAFVLIVGFFGCCGALRKNRCMLIIYIIFLVIVMILEIAAGVLAIVYKDKFQAELEDQWKDRVKTFYSTDEKYTAFREAINLFQEKLKCCGLKSYQDYKMATCPSGGNCTQTNGVPYSCCEKPDVCKTKTNPPKDDYHKDGCEAIVVDWLEEKVPLLAGIGIGIACLELFGLIFAICLCANVDDD